MAVIVPMVLCSTGVCVRRVMRCEWKEAGVEKRGIPDGDTDVDGAVDAAGVDACVDMCTDGVVTDAAV